MRYFEDLSPDPSSHVKTLMRIGYTLPSAVADILDNSISAEARRIEIIAPPGQLQPIISILDDGVGMDPMELVSNMRIGCKNPLTQREQGDLGRFGSGMKTASFSQARRLTVISKKEGFPITAAIWDIDVIEKENIWALEVIKGNNIKDIPGVKIHEGIRHGTQIIWERISCFSTDSHTGDLDEELAAQLTNVKGHIALHFHRFMKGKNRVKIYLNGSLIEPLDPFLKSIDGYQEGREERFRCKGGFVKIKTHVLPHIKRIPAAELERHGGASSISRSQGIYIYREERLINAGGWLGLATNNQLGALARVQVDIPSTLDHEWSTDVKKSSLQLPSRVKKELRKYLADPIKRSKRAYTYRGKKDTANLYWKVCEDEIEKRVTYQIDPSNDKLLAILKACPQELRTELLNYLAEVSSSIPVNHIYQKMSESPSHIQQDTVDTSIFESILDKVFGD